MSHGRHAAPVDHRIARAAVGTAAGAALVSGSFLAVTPEQVAAHKAADIEPATSEMHTTPAPPLTPAAASSPTYMVQPGDYLSKIAPRYGETWQGLYAANRTTIGADPDLIQPGEELVVGPETQPIGPAAPTPVAGPATQPMPTPAPPPVASHANPDVAAQIVADAQAVVAHNVPYVWGGTSLAGMDCSGLTQFVMRENGINLPRTALEQSQTGSPVPSLADAQPGDLVFFYTPVEHVGIYIGDGQMIAESTFGTVAHVQSVWTTPTVIRRYV